jgi:hypothetical protein
MLKQLLLMASSVVIVVCIVWSAAGVAEWLRHPRITEREFMRIETGMRQEDVDAIFGAPPGDYRRGDVSYLPSNHSIFMLFCARAETWSGDAGQAEVKFDGDGRVVDMWFRPTPKSTLEAWFEDMMNWLKP